MEIESRLIEAPLPQPDIVIIGRGDIGDKAGQLVGKTPAIKRIGFHVPRRTILAEDVFDNFFQQNGLGANLRDVQPSSTLENQIRQGTLPEATFAILNKIVDGNKSDAVVVRSSGHGDARGIGIYNSEFSEGRTEKVGEALKAVLASYFSKDAIAFRRDAQLAEGFGVIIEPLIGQVFHNFGVGEILAPPLSGFGYTSTARDDGYIIAVPGIGGGVETRGGLRLTRIILQQSEGNIVEYILNNPIQTEGTSLSLVFDEEFNYGQSVILSSASGEKGLAPVFAVEAGSYRELLRNANLSTLFDMTEELERVFKRPQYLEWAMTVQNGELSFWITQIADADPKLDFIDFANLGEPVLDGHTVVGAGTKDCNMFVICVGENALEGLEEFNAKNKGYIIVYSSQLTKSSARKRLQYHHYSNAAVLIEIPGAHSQPALGHMEEDIEKTDKFFGILKRSNDWKGFIEGPFLENATVENGIRVMSGNFRIIASGRQNKIVITRGT